MNRITHIILWAMAIFIALLMFFIIVISNPMQIQSEQASSLAVNPAVNSPPLQDK